jgi:hypothetical protein
MTAAALVICTPEFQWYALLLVMLVALDGRPEWLALAAGGYLAGNRHLTATLLLPHAQFVGYAGGAAVIGAIAFARWKGVLPTRSGELMDAPEAETDSTDRSRESGRPAGLVYAPRASKAIITIGTDGAPAFASSSEGSQVLPPAYRECIG